MPCVGQEEIQLPSSVKIDRPWTSSNSKVLNDHDITPICTRSTLYRRSQRKAGHTPTTTENVGTSTVSMKSAYSLVCEVKRTRTKAHVGSFFVFVKTDDCGRNKFSILNDCHIIPQLHSKHSLSPKPAESGSHSDDDGERWDISSFDEKCVIYLYLLWCVYTMSAFLWVS